MNNQAILWLSRLSIMELADQVMSHSPVYKRNYHELNIHDEHEDEETQIDHRAW
jgi:hypothetical protein